MRLTTKIGKREVLIGMFDNKTGIFTKHVSRKDYNTKEKGYAIPIDTIEKLIDLGCDKVLLVTEIQILEYSFDSIVGKESKDCGEGRCIYVTIKEANVLKKEIKPPSWLRKG